MTLSFLELSTICLFVFRYLRLVVNALSHWSFRAIPIPADPTYTSDNVTVIIPTIDGDGEELRRTIRSCIATEPAAILIVTIEANLRRALATAAAFGSKRLRVLCIPKANKRRQMCAAIPMVETDIVVFADDDVIWPATLMPWLLAPFEDAGVGAVGTSQRLVRPAKPSLWSYLGSCYLERRNFDCSACLNIDGGLPCLSGRTAAYRSEILQAPDFTREFRHEKWGSYLLNADDDNFLTRYVLKRGWKIAMQYHKAAEVQTTLEDGPVYLKQCLRWVRSNWRSNITSMFVERQYWWTHPWTTYAVLQTTLTAWAATDMLLYFILYHATARLDAATRSAILVAATLWIFILAKAVKLMGHFLRYPADMALLPLSILFGYVHGIIKLIGLFSLSETAWGNREGADDDDEARMIPPPPYGASTARDAAALSVVSGKLLNTRLPSYRSCESLKASHPDKVHD